MPRNPWVPLKAVGVPTIYEPDVDLLVKIVLQRRKDAANQNILRSTGLTYIIRWLDCAYTVTVGSSNHDETKYYLSIAISRNNKCVCRFQDKNHHGNAAIKTNKKHQHCKRAKTGQKMLKLLFLMFLHFLWCNERRWRKLFSLVQKQLWQKFQLYSQFHQHFMSNWNI